MSKPNEEPGAEEKKDLFHHGVVSKLFPSNNLGLVRTESGREVPFSFDLVILVGDVKKPSELKEGQVVGYDVGWTSNGLRVTKMKVYSEPLPAEGSSDFSGRSEGK